MASLDTNLNNFSYWEILDTIFGRYSTDFVYTAKGIFRRTKPPLCPECGMQMNYNGYNAYEKTVIPPAEDVRIVLYDEQHPKKGRAQKFRLTLLDGVTGQPIAEELYDSKDPATIMAFLVKYLDPNKRTFVVYFVKDAPATNNGVENYYSTSLKTHSKKQLRADKGIEKHMKLSAMKRAGLLGRCKKTLLEAFLMFVPFLDHG